MYVCMYVYMYVCMYACMYVCMYVCIYICIHACIYVCMYVCIYSHFPLYWLIIKEFNYVFKKKGHWLKIMPKVLDDTIDDSNDTTTITASYSYQQNVNLCLRAWCWCIYFLVHERQLPLFAHRCNIYICLIRVHCWCFSYSKILDQLLSWE